MDIEGWGSPMWELKCLKCVTLQRGKTTMLIINTSGSHLSKNHGEFYECSLVQLACRWGKRKSGKMASIYLYLTDAETDAQWASNLHRCLVMTAMQLAWCKHLTSQTLTAQDAVKILPEKIFVSCVDSFCEANHPPHPPPGKGWPELAQMYCCFCKVLGSIWFMPYYSALHVSCSACVYVRLPTV